MKKISSFKMPLFLVFLIIFVITFFTKEKYKSTELIMPEVLKNPIQTEVYDHSILKFDRNGYSYKALPLYEYDISGLVVSRLKYNNWYSLSRTDFVFPIDICLMWGDNVKNGEFKKKGLSFRQDSRFCFFEYFGRSNLSTNEISNNHLVVSNDFLERLAKSISIGDQIRIKGKLVDVEAEANSEVGMYEPVHASWKTSIERTDSGAGACEIIYLESITILKKGNQISHFLFEVSKYGILFMVVWFFLELFIFMFSSKERP